MCLTSLSTIFLNISPGRTASSYTTCPFISASLHLERPHQPRRRPRAAKHAGGRFRKWPRQRPSLYPTRRQQAMVCWKTLPTRSWRLRSRWRRQLLLDRGGKEKLAVKSLHRQPINRPLDRPRRVSPNVSRVGRPITRCTTVVLLKRWFLTRSPSLSVFTAVAAYVLNPIIGQLSVSRVCAVRYARVIITL